MFFQTVPDGIVVSLQANYDAVWDGLEKHFFTEQKA
ncbi:hypothetical protein QWA_18065 [Alcaligenes faecalis subsp. faecalis NCIB 8687]|nr:hypothetical protein QWA_18065 [Alcaligenes faecalis subsp. faecalis NCIB 8687]